MAIQRLVIDPRQTLIANSRDLVACLPQNDR
jgi:hypothetical protein